MTQTTEGTGPGSVDRVKPRILNGVVRSENIPPSTVINADVADGSISTAKLANSAVSTAKLANNAVTVAKMKTFKSSEQTGTGSAQSIAHGLGSTPSLVMVFPTDTSVATAGQYVVTEGTHTSTNVVVTVTTGKKYVVVAFA